MSEKDEFHNLEKPDNGLLRELAPGVMTRIFAGEHAMLSVVTIAPNAEGVDAPSPRGAVGRAAGRLRDTLPGRRGNPGQARRFLAHAGQRAAHDARRAGGARVLDIFSPPRAENKKAGKGFG